MHPFYFQDGDRTLFAVLHRATAPRALLLMCPPLLHEHARSYRFFSQLADRFARDGVSCLRFDYFGTGDSGGDDAQFDPARARDDIVAAARQLRANADAQPLILMGIRGSALLAAGAADVVGADALWLWQPESDGSQYLRTLEAQDLEARSDAGRYPGRMLPRPAGDAELLGFRAAPGLRENLRACTLAPIPAALPVAIVAGPDESMPAIPQAVLHRLRASASDWAGEIDMRSVIPLRDTEPVVQALLGRLPTARAFAPTEFAYG